MSMSLSFLLICWISASKEWSISWSSIEEGQMLWDGMCSLNLSAGSVSIFSFWWEGSIDDWKETLALTELTCLEDAGWLFRIMLLLRTVLLVDVTWFDKWLGFFVWLNILFRIPFFPPLLWALRDCCMSESLLERVSLVKTKIFLFSWVLSSSFLTSW